MARKRVLVVASDAAALRVARDALDGAPIDAGFVESAEDARAALAKARVDVLICDRELSDVSGLTLLRWAYVKHPRTVSVMLTDPDQGDDIITAINNTGVYRLVKHPIEPKLLRKALIESLRRSEATTVRQAQIPRQVVIIEESPNRAAEVTDILREAKLNAEYVTQGAISAAIARRDGPNVLVTGPETCTATALVGRLRRGERLPRTHLVVLSAHDLVRDIADTFDAGADDYLVKPLKRAELIARVRARLNALDGMRDGLRRAAWLDRGLEPERDDARMTPGLRKLIRSGAWQSQRESIGAVLEEVMTTPATVVEGKPPTPHLVSRIGLTDVVNELEVGVIATADDDSLRALTELMFGEVLEEEAVLKDMFREILNMVMGRLKIAFLEHGFEFSGSLPESLDRSHFGAACKVYTRRCDCVFALGKAQVRVVIGVCSKRNREVDGGELYEGMVVAENVENDNGLLLVTSGTRLTSNHIRRLRPVLAGRKVAVNVPGDTYETTETKQPA